MASFSSGGTGAGRRWVERGWPTTQQALRSETPNWAGGLDGPPAAVRGRSFPVQLFQHVDVEGLGHDLLEAGLLALELFEAFGVVGLRAAVLVAPAVPGRLGDLKVPAHLLDLLPWAKSFSLSASLRITCSGVW